MRHTMEKYIAARKDNPREYPIQRSTFTDYKCKAIHTGLRDCAMHQPEWPVELDQGTHCNRLLHFVNETYFQDQAVSIDVTTKTATTTSTEAVTSGPKPIIDKGTENFRQNPDANLESVQGTSNEEVHGKDEEGDGNENIYYFILGFILGILFYIVAARIFRIVLGLSPVLNINSGSNSSAAFFYVSTTPTAILKESMKPLLPTPSTFTSRSAPIVTTYSDNAV